MRTASFPPAPNPLPAAPTTRARRMSVERLEERQLLSAAEFELSSLLPANGGDGSKGFVVSGVVDGGKLGNPRLFTRRSAT